MLKSGALKQGKRHPKHPLLTPSSSSDTVKLRAYAKQLTDFLRDDIVLLDKLRSVVSALFGEKQIESEEGAIFLSFVAVLVLFACPSSVCIDSVARCFRSAPTSPALRSVSCLSVPRVRALAVGCVPSIWYGSGASVLIRKIRMAAMTQQEITGY